MVTSLFTAYGVQHLELHTALNPQQTFHNKTSGGTSQQQTASETCFLRRTTLLFTVTTLPNKGTTQYMGNLPQMITACNRRNVTVTTSRKTTTRKTGAATKSPSRSSPSNGSPTTLSRSRELTLTLDSFARSLYTAYRVTEERQIVWGAGSIIMTWWISASASG